MKRTQLLSNVLNAAKKNYIGTRNKRKHPEKMEIKKYCPRCNKKTTHKEKNKRSRILAFYFV